MSLSDAMALGAAGLSAQRTRMEIISSNLANAKTTRMAGGELYRRKMPVFTAESLDGTSFDPARAALKYPRVVEIVEDLSPPLMRFEPGHPDADEAGMVLYPNVNLVREMVDMLSATRSYEAGVTLIRSLRDMQQGALQIIA